MVPATCAAGPMRFGRGQVCLNLFESGESGHDFCDYLRRGGAVFCDGSAMMFGVLFAVYIDVDKGAQAVVLAEIAACIFVARCAIVDVRNGFKTDKGGGS